MHRGAGLVEVDPQRLRRPLAAGRRGADPRRPLRPGRAAGDRSSARASTSSARRRPSTGCWPSAPSCDPFPPLRRLVSAGEPLNPEVIRLLPRARSAWPIHDGYGQTETGRQSPGCARTKRTTRAATARWAARCRGSRSASTTASCRFGPRPCPSFFSRYLGERALRRGSGGRRATTCARTTTGTSGSRAASDDIIVSAGYRIGPFEVESALVSHPAVAEAAAVAAPDEERGSVVRAVVVLRDGEPSEELGRRAPGARQGGDGALQVPAHRRVRRGAAEDLQRQDQARSPSSRAP